MKVISQAEVLARGRGGVLELDDDAMLTPLAEDEARRLGVEVRRSGPRGLPSQAVIRQVTQQVVSRLGDARPEVLEAVIAETLAALDGGLPTERLGAGIDVCQLCLDQERSRARRRAVLTTTGRNQKGIVARITSRLSELGGDIVDISQTLVGEFFTMIIVVDVGSLAVDFAQFKGEVEATVAELGLGCMLMHEDVLVSLHRP
jgi:ACT domain-containing protein